MRYSSLKIKLRISRKKVRSRLGRVWALTSGPDCYQWPLNCPSQLERNEKLAWNLSDKIDDFSWNILGHTRIISEWGRIWSGLNVRILTFGQIQSSWSIPLVGLWKLYRLVKQRIFLASKPQRNRNGVIIRSQWIHCYLIYLAACQQ